MKIKNLWNKYFAEDSSNTIVQLFRYLIVGSLAFVVDYFVSIISVRTFSLYEVYATVLGFIFGLVTNYLISTLWIFRTRKLENKNYDFLAFSFIGIIGLGLKAGVVWFLTEIPEIVIEFSNPVATIIVFFWNFLARKYLLYNKKG